MIKLFCFDHWKIGSRIKTHEYTVRIHDNITFWYAVHNDMNTNGVGTIVYWQRRDFGSPEDASHQLTA